MSITKILSYPPVFRRIELPDPVNHRPDLSVDRQDQLPVIDMACFDKAKLHMACSDWGIFRVINHGIPEELISRLHASTKSSFDLPFETKREIFTNPNPVYSWGNKALHKKTPAGLPEVGVEVFDVSVVPCQHCDDDDDVTSFRHALEEYGKYMTILTRELFKAMASNLKLDQHQAEKDDLGKYLDELSGQIRVNR